MLGQRGIVDELNMVSPRREDPRFSRSYLASLLFCRKMIQSATHDAIHLLERSGYHVGLPTSDAAIARAWIEKHSEKLVGPEYYVTFDWCCEWLGTAGISKLSHDILHLGAFDTKLEDCFKYKRCEKCQSHPIDSAGELRFALCDMIEQAWMKSRIDHHIGLQLKLFEPLSMPVLPFDINTSAVALVI